MIEMNNGQVRLHQGDSRDVLKTLTDSSIDSIVCDPPYALVSIQKRFGKPGSAAAKHGTDGAFARAARGFMGKDWDVADTAFAETFWAECLRVLKPGGHVVAFGGTRTYHRLVCAIEDAGFEIRDQLGWVYGSGFPKSHSQTGDWQGWGSALKPAWEPICLARKPLTGTIAGNLAEWGVGALNIDGCRVPTDGPTARPPLSTNKHEGWQRPWNENELARAACEERREESHDKRDILGRWPANIIHDGSDEVLAAFPDAKSGSRKAGEHGLMGYHGADAAPMPAIDGDSGSAARFFYCAKASRKDRDEGLAHLPKQAGGMVSETSGQHITRRDADYKPEPRANIHPTVKPTDLMRYLGRLITPPGGTILDPFMGSGSTGKAAVLEGFNFVGIEREDEYMPIAEARIAWAVLRMAGGIVDHEPAAVAPQPQPANDNAPDLFTGAA
jgi:site-specific DNA-methyltransferase (adenine-specific)